MEHLLQSLILPINGFLVACFLPLCAWILLSGADDLLLDLICGFHFFCFKYLNKRKILAATPEQLEKKPQRAIAIFVPLWHEHRVIARAVQHNISAIRYKNFHFFIGAYPNDEPTMAALQQLERSYSNVHMALCPHDGPTSKADCLNWVYQRMQRFEEERGAHFDLVMTHDAEDLIHPESLLWMNWYADRYDMIQVPVLPLATPVRFWTHGVYCDEFAEQQSKDMLARQFFDSYIPSCGVGTGFKRSALNQLAVASQNRIFEPTCLTEDYENGIRLHELGAKQLFVPVRFRQGVPMATREFFPQSFRAAVKQRTRWIMGITLQGWEKRGWRGPWLRKYWFWRDRKGLVGSLVSISTNVMCFWWLAVWCLEKATTWHLGPGFEGIPESERWIFPAASAIGFFRAIVRMVLVSRVYGFFFALWVPLRVLYSNVINASAAISAVTRYTKAKLRHEPLVWLKTEHAYPTQAALTEHKRRLGEVLVGSDYVTGSDLEHALSSQPKDVKIGQHLVNLGLLAETDLYEALSLQQSLPLGRVYTKNVSKSIARVLPKRVMKEWKVLPFKIETGNLFIAGTELPSEAMQKDLQRFTSLEIRFQLITPSNYEELAARLL